MAPLLQVCCFRVCLRTATLIIGYLAMFGSLYSVVHNTVQLSWSLYPNISYRELQEYQVERDYSGFRIGFAILSGVNFYASLIVIMGVWKDKPRYILVWLVLNVPYALCTLVFLAAMTVAYRKREESVAPAQVWNRWTKEDFIKEYHKSYIMMAVTATLIPSLSVYFLLVVYSYYQTFKLKDSEPSNSTVPDAIEMQAV